MDGCETAASRRRCFGDGARESRLRGLDGCRPERVMEPVEGAEVGTARQEVWRKSQEIDGCGERGQWSVLVGEKRVRWRTRPRGGGSEGNWRVGTLDSGCGGGPDQRPLVHPGEATS